MNKDTPVALADPNQILDTAPMKIRQWLIVLICLGLMALDGYSFN